jgi:mono/diheme cytochrome c family protein
MPENPNNDRQHVHTIVCLVLLPFVSAGACSAAADSSTQARQVQRGAATFERVCSRCHAKDLTGGQGPALKGDAFAGHWLGKPVRALYSRILLTMPLDSPGTLTSRQVLDLAAFITAVNGFEPVGIPFATPEQLGKMTLQAHQ